MKVFRADLHIHTVLSPCGDLTMSPDVIVERALAMGLDMIGITDHNSTRQCQTVTHLAARHGITVLSGAEVTTREEIHCLAFFENDEQLALFQAYLDQHLPNIPNDTRRFGHQVVLDSRNNITYTEPRLLISAIDQSIGQTEEKVHALGGLFIPAHIDKQRFSLLGQLGFLPPSLRPDALEVSPFCELKPFLNLHTGLADHIFISGSDAHLPDQIGSRTTLVELNSCSFQDLKWLLSSNQPDKIKIASSL